MNFPLLSPFAPENLTLQLAHLHTQAESGAYVRDFSRFPRRPSFVYLNRHKPSGQSRDYRDTQLRIDGVHRRVRRHDQLGTDPIAYDNLNKQMKAAAEIGRNPVSKHQIQPEYGDKQADAGRDCRARLRDQTLRRERGRGKNHFPCSADHEQDWQPYPVDPYSCYI